MFVALVAYITWVGVRGEQPKELVMRGYATIVSAPPANARVGEATPFTWEVRAPVGAAATHTAIHWGTTSVPGTIGTDVAPADAGYPEHIRDYESGTFALPRSFTAAAVFPTSGISSYRAHAIIDGKHYWSPEHQVVVE